MTPLSKLRFQNRTMWRAVIAVSLVSLSFIIAATYSMAKPESTPADTRTSTSRNLEIRGSPIDDSADSVSADSDSLIAPSSTFAPFLDIVPLQDGTGLFISASGIGELGGTVFANVSGIGPTSDKHSWTMTYSNTEQSYVATAVGFTPGENDDGELSITTTLGLDTGTVDFNRAYVPASTSQTIKSVDGNMELELVNTDTITFNTYMVVVPSYGPPGPLPLGHRLIGNAYSVRAAGALVQTDKPMLLRLYYNDSTLAGADPHVLTIYTWDAYNKQWEDLEGGLFYSQQFHWVTRRMFGTYALMATTTWRDEFDDYSGLNYPDEVSDVDIGLEGENRVLVLASSAISGTATSKPITPTADFANWGSLTFTHTVEPPTTTLTVDILTPDGTEVLTDVANGVDLSDLDAGQYPALKLRGNLSSSVPGETPAMDVWQLTWQAEEHEVYLPLVLR